MRHEGVGTGATFDAVADLLLAKEIPGYPPVFTKPKKGKRHPTKHRRSVKSLCRSQYKYLLGSAS
jgi:hypothetical protein